MTVKAVRSLLSAMSPASGVYAGLASSEPLAEPPFEKCTVQGPVGHRSVRRLNKLSEKQSRTFLGMAVKRIRGEAADRSGQYLRRLDNIHQGGSRSRAERWQALSAVAEPLLCRLDLATGVLGYLDNNGQFQLSRQNKLAEDAGISPVRLSRLVHALIKAKYALRKIKRLYKEGKKWVCRITIYMRHAFFHDLGLGMEHATARTAKAKTYRKKKRLADHNDMQARMSALAEAQARRMSHRAAQGKRESSAAATANTNRIEATRRKAAAISELAKANPGLGHAELMALYSSSDPS